MKIKVGDTVMLSETNEIGRVIKISYDAYKTWFEVKGNDWEWDVLRNEMTLLYSANDILKGLL